jgi:hypothetical protein
MTAVYRRINAQPAWIRFINLNTNRRNEVFFSGPDFLAPWNTATRSARGIAAFSCLGLDFGGYF